MLFLAMLLISTTSVAPVLLTATFGATNEFTNGQTAGRHLGSGASLSAIEDGRDSRPPWKSYSTDGLIMGNFVAAPEFSDPARLFSISLALVVTHLR